MKLKKTQKIISTLILIVMIVSQLGGVFATEIGEIKDLENLRRMWKRFIISKR